MKKVLILSIALVANALSGFSQALGDVNNSGSIDIVDALLVAQYFVGLNPSNFNTGVADVNASGAIDIVDGLLIAQFYVGLISEFPGQGTAVPTATPTGTSTPTPTPTTTPDPTADPVTGKFPYSGKAYQYGLASASTSQASDNNFVLTEWQSWKSTYVTSDGAGGNLRVKRPENSNDTVSEGIAYGMLLAVYMDDQATVNGLWAYGKARLDANGLMNWHYDSSGNIAGTDKNAATDADEDMALALIFANKKWGGNNYQQDATNLCNAIMSKEVEAGTNVLKPGDAWGGSTCTNISYYSPASYKVFASFTGNSGWNNVVNKCYEVINLAKNQNTNLVPDWCTAQGTHTTQASFDSNADNYYFDAVRFPWRISWDYLWYGDTQAQGNLNKITAFFASKGAANIKGGYTLDGNTVIGNYKDACFVATAAAGAMEGSNASFAQSCFTEMKNTKSNQYYQDCLRLMCLLVSTGNFPNLYTY
jgi:endo-1,4-beta-D-glucanase Y